MLGIVTGLELETKLCLEAFKDAGRPAPLIACAAGTAKGARRAAQQLINSGATRLISLGVCGGLAPDIKSGDLILPKNIIMNDETLATDTRWIDELKETVPNIQTGPMVSVHTAIDTIDGKAQLYQRSRALAVDVESFAVVKAAQNNGLTAIVIRAVLDPAAQSLPSAALNGVNDKGETQIWPVIKALLKHPKELPDLIRLGRQNKQAAQTLTDFIKKAAL